jgi:hypothetical protein
VAPLALAADDLELVQRGAGRVEAVELDDLPDAAPDVGDDLPDWVRDFEKTSEWADYLAAEAAAAEQANPGDADDRADVDDLPDAAPDVGDDLPDWLQDLVQLPEWADYLAAEAAASEANQGDGHDQADVEDAVIGAVEPEGAWRGYAAELDDDSDTLPVAPQVPQPYMPATPHDLSLPRMPATRLRSIGRNACLDAMTRNVCALLARLPPQRMVSEPLVNWDQADHIEVILATMFLLLTLTPNVHEAAVLLLTALNNYQSNNPFNKPPGKGIIRNIFPMSFVLYFRARLLEALTTLPADWGLNTSNGLRALFYVTLDPDYLTANTLLKVVYLAVQMVFLADARMRSKKRDDPADMASAIADTQAFWAHVESTC